MDTREMAQAIDGGHERFKWADKSVNGG